MAYYFIQVSSRSPTEAELELNGFLRNHRILAVDRRWVDQGENSYWAFCVDYQESSGSQTPAGSSRNGNRAKVDYREQLSKEDFAVFSRLRQLRKEIAQSEAVPVYVVFTNEQLAEMVKSRAATRADMERIAGVGDARVDKYGARILEFLTHQWNGSSDHAPSQPPV